ncbi:UNKNOWN [Stylonychia lemnae]|uniref:Uncharacterized protein n=1 Tax=Stylonychia lemnae TaxID=5949 RepID=A0A077ZUZ5_STYLE|nr:UNKNOWN [Stylonychia lemnae]|eukprot:CDW73404.1 UNKNOWN [Stylonychia lemnae]
MDRKYNDRSGLATQSVLSKEDLEEKLREMKNLIEQQRQLQNQLQNNLSDKQQKPQNHNLSLDQSVDAGQQRQYPSYEVLHNPLSPLNNNLDNSQQVFERVNIVPPLNIHHKQNENLLTSSQFVVLNKHKQDDDNEADAEYDFKTPSKQYGNNYTNQNKQKSNGKHANDHNQSKNNHSPYCVNEENLKFRIAEYQRREKDYEKTIQKLQARLAIQEEQTIDVREKSSEKQKRYNQDTIAFAQEIKELKQQIQYKNQLLEGKERELGQSKKEILSNQAETSKLTERIDQLNLLVKSRQNESTNFQRQIEDLKHQLSNKKSTINQLQVDLENEKKSKQTQIQKIEEENRQKFSQLKFLVDQYRQQMHEYQKITQQNQELMGQINQNQTKKRNQSVSYPKFVQGEQEEGQEKVGGRKHYKNNNLKDSISDLFKQDEAPITATQNRDSDNQYVSIRKSPVRETQKLQQHRTEYGKLCSSAEKHKRNNDLDVSTSLQSNNQSNFQLKKQSLMLPSYQKFQDNQDQIKETEHQLLNKSKDTLIKAEKNRIGKRT